MSKPKVLVFIDWYTPGFKAGGPVRSMVNMVAHLHDEVDFHIVTSDTEYTESNPYPNVVADKWTTGDFGEQIYYSSQHGRSRNIWELLLDSEGWDAIYINGMYSPWFSAAPLWFTRKSQVRRIVASRGMLAPGPMAHSKLKKKTFLWVMKRFGAYKDVHFQATNKQEAEYIEAQIGKHTQVSVVPNLPKPVDVSNHISRSKEPGSLRIISVARIAVEKNTLFAIECLVGLKGKVTYNMFGSIYRVDYWELCQQAIKSLPSNVTVISHGPQVPHNIARLMQDAHVLLMPSQGENFGHSMLEALSVGLPILISNKTPWKELEKQRAGWDLPLDPIIEAQTMFEKKLQSLVDMGQSEYDIWSKGAFDYAQKYFRTSTAIEKNLELFRWKEVR